MKGSEVLKALEEGKKMRIKDWRQHEYIYKNENNEIVDEEDIDQNMLGLNIFWKGEWKEYIDSKFKVDDWVVFEKLNIVTKIIREDDSCKIKRLFTDYKSNDVNQSFLESELRKATEDEIKQELERRKWEKIGRDVNQFEIGDIVRYWNENEELVYGQIELNGHTADDFIRPFNESDENRYNLDNIELVVPVENRFDKVK